uniref:Uncharacterized protein n=1 Tax=Steinernema glaseri TaxID=37863 RepID=A0A1I7ZLL5_9BILA
MRLAPESTLRIKRRWLYQRVAWSLLQSVKKSPGDMQLRSDSSSIPAVAQASAEGGRMSIGDQNGAAPQLVTFIS